MEKRYVALLRGINVGGKNVIKMADLKASFEAMGFAEVATLIQSGNVLFTAAGTTEKPLSAKIEKGLSKRFGYEAKVVVISRKQLAAVLKQAPNGFGKEPALYRYDVIFLRPPVTPKQAMAAVSLREGVDAAHAGKHAVYFSRVIAKAAQSRLPKVIQHPLYQFMTIRNWNTTTKLFALI